MFGRLINALYYSSIFLLKTVIYFLSYVLGAYTFLKNEIWLLLIKTGC